MPDMDADLFACLQCGYCKSACPAYAQMGWESNTPRGKLFALKLSKSKMPLVGRLVKGGKLGQDFFETLYHCTSCGACDEVCHVRIPLSSHWEDVKEWMVEEGKAEALPAHRALLERISDPKRRSPFFDEKDPEKDALTNRAAWLPNDARTSENPEVAYFAGCTSSYRQQQVAQAFVLLLAKAGMKFAYLGPDEWCCGSPLLRTGQGKIIKGEIARHNINALNGTGARTVATTCAGCLKTIRNDYPKFAGKLPFRALHATEYLESLIREKKLSPSKPLNKKIAYHDPCHLGRHAGVYDAPRNVLKSIPGVALVEFGRSREKSRCCGGGGGFRAGFAQASDDIAAERLREAQDAGAEIIATSCPLCAVTLNSGAKRAGIGIKTVDVCELLLQSL